MVIGTWNTSAGPLKVAGWMLFATGAGALYFGAALPRAVLQDLQAASLAYLTACAYGSKRAWVRGGSARTESVRCHAVPAEGGG